jgi:CheY-like chemotaxis protein
MSSRLAKPAETAAAPYVLIVDDSVGMRRYLRTVLSAVGCECQEVANGAEALDRILNSRFDLVLTDLDMPEMNGFELLLAIDLLKDSICPPVIVVSALIEDGLEERRPELRLAEALLSKPVDLPKLLAAVRSAIGAAGRCSALAYVRS